MKRYKQFAPVLISDFEVSDWIHPVHNHNHYEIIYIKNGIGNHIINSKSIKYNDGCIFLLGPEDEHYFEIERITNFVYLKFTDLYIHQAEGIFNSGLRHLEYLIKSRETHLSGFVFNDEDQVTINRIFDVIISMKKEVLRNEDLIWMQVLTLAHLLQRNMREIKSNTHRTKDMQAVFCYIHKNIYYPENLRAQVMGEHFRFTKDYIGQYFKKNTGMTIREYISDYRGNLISQRINTGRFSLKQIASEFGLTDESHVSKLIKQKRDHTRKT
ncbi:AraC family ligand binding domain-containing protein [Pedobacter cryoconitis]|uniref:AraC family ligand binding domain-containing protein n=1 Tax=Pedobacter cryoconitis TaxID=188932 RepID=UPI00160EF7E8|nr:AraC family transcriptional regulator [Pedobacter cryoconitis]MBB5645939.1 YesN/AraC family two-component response regulator [Pedobacter cryoconitis]